MTLICAADRCVKLVALLQWCEEKMEKRSARCCNTERKEKLWRRPDAVCPVGPHFVRVKKSYIKAVSASSPVFCECLSREHLSADPTGVLTFTRIFFLQKSA